jgi:D-alanyl-D-alanine dipeptidase
MSEYAWATVPAHSLGPAVPWPVSPLPPLFDADAADAAPLPGVPAGAAGDEDPLVQVEGISMVGVYRRHEFPYAVDRAYLRSEVAERLAAAAGTLPAPFGLAVFDGWRDPRLQQFLYDRAYAEPGLPPGFVAPPTGDPTRPTPHSTGGTVDLTLTWEGQPLGLGTEFDEFTVRAFTRALESDLPDDASAEVPDWAEAREGAEAPDVLARDLRRLLYAVMSSQGFVVLAREWWHFEYGTRLWSAVTGEAPLYHAAPRPPDDPAT